MNATDTWVIVLAAFGGGLVGVVAAVTAGAVALGGAGSYARRHRPR